MEYNTKKFRFNYKIYNQEKEEEYILPHGKILEELEENKRKEALSFCFGNIPKINQENFRFINALQRNYDKLDNIYHSVSFPISRNTRIEETIVFNKRMSEDECIYIIEEYLSMSITKDFYDEIEDFRIEKFNMLKTRGDCLGCLIFLEGIINNNGELNIELGS